MPFPLFLIFTIMAVAGAIALVAFRNPVSSALSMVVSFVGMAALFIGMNAYFVGIIQILVYTGAIMVLFLFIIMLLDLKVEEKVKVKALPLAGAVILPAVLIFQIMGVLQDTPETTLKELDPKAAAASYTEGTVIRKKLEEGKIPDVNLIGNKIFKEHNFPLQVMGVLLLVATVGCVALSKKDQSSKG